MRKIIICLLSAALLSTVPFVQAQQAKKVPRIGYLSTGLLASASAYERIRIEAFREGLRDLGYIEGQNILIEYRHAEGKYDRFPDLAAELVRLKVDVIVAAGGTPAIRAAMQATKTIPIVMPVVGDPVASGLVASLARPGGNVTGLTIISPELSGKRLELLKEAFPRVTRVGVLANATNPENEVALKGTEVPASSLGVKLQIIKVSDADELSNAFSAMSREHASALNVLSDAMFTLNQKRIVDLAAKSRLPAIYPSSDYVEAGGLMSYGPNYADLFRRAATYVDKILKGAKPADLPVEQPTKFELVINLKTAKQIGLTIPPNVLARADKVIK